MKKQSLPLAMLTSFLVATAGAVVWGLMYYQGWFVGYISLVSMFATGWCYLKFYYKMDWKFYVWNISIVVILNLISSILCDLFVIMAIYNVTFSSAFSFYQQLLADSAYRTMYILNILSNLIFSTFGIGFAVYIFRGRNYVNMQIEKTKNSSRVEEKHSEIVSADVISLCETIIAEYVNLFKQTNLESSNFIEKRKQIEEKYLNNLPESLKNDMMKYIDSIKAGTAEEENALKLLKIKLK